MLRVYHTFICVLFPQFEFDSLCEIVCPIIITQSTKNNGFSNSHAESSCSIIRLSLQNELNTKGEQMCIFLKLEYISFFSTELCRRRQTYRGGKNTEI